MILNKRSKAPATEDLTYLFGQPEKPIGQWGIEKKNDSDAIKVSLSDCLACSGCVTSAETVLLEAQSVDEFKQQVAACAQSGGRRVTVVSVAPQSRASLAHAAGLSALDAAKRLTGFFKSMGVVAVFDTTAARDFSLLEAGEEFVERFRASRRSRDAASNQSQSQNQNQNQSQNQNQNPNPLPVLASACPGWVCYAEKQSPGVLPHISNVKSPQQVMGTIVKRRVAAALGLDPAAVFHVAVMPCYDKKLEASRGDFRGEPGGDGDGGEGPPDVDCVLTTGEVAELLAGAFGIAVKERDGYSTEAAGAREGAAALARVPPAPLDGWLASFGTGRRPSPSSSGAGAPGDDAEMDMDVDAAVDADASVAASGADANDEWVWGCDSKEGGGGSGGYLEHVFRYAAAKLFGIEVRGALEYKIPRARNLDLREVTLEGPDGTTLLRFAQAYGFRNIQNMVRKIKPTAHDIHLGTSRDGCGYDYVEIMACPSGCLNGGGPAPAAAAAGGDRGDRRRETAGDDGEGAGGRARDEVPMGRRHRGAAAAGCEPGGCGGVPRLGARGGGFGERARARLFHTRYHDRGAEAAAAAGGAVAAAAQLKLTSDW